MAFDLAALTQELDKAPPAAELPWAVAVAVVSDTFRLAGLAPPSPRQWESWRRKWPRAQELVATLAWLLVATALRGETVRSLQDRRPNPAEIAQEFLDGV